MSRTSKYAKHLDPPPNKSNGSLQKNNTGDIFFLKRGSHYQQSVLRKMRKSFGLV